jgi:hypothetical protein
MDKDKLGTVEPVEAALMEQPVDEKEQKLVEEVYSRLEVFRQGCSEMHGRYKDARQIILLQDPYQDITTSSTDAITGLEVTDTTSTETTVQLQTLKSTFNNCVADQMDNMPEALLVPETPELQQQAEDATDIVRYILNTNGYEGVHRRRVEDYLGPGTAVTHVAWDAAMDYGKGNIAVIRWPIESFLWDPQAEDIQDSRAVMQVAWRPMSWYSEHYPDKAKYISADDGTHDDIAVPESQEDKVGGDEEKALLIAYWYRRYNAQTKRYSINVAYFAGRALLERHEDVYTHGLYPFVIDAYTPIEGIPVGDGMIQELVPMMRCINRYNRYMDTNARMSSKGRLLIKRGSNIDKKALMDWSSSVIEGDKIDKENLDWLQNQPFNGVIQNQMLQLQMDLKQDSGQNQFTRGETAGGVTAASAISALQEAGGKITRLRTTVLNQGFRKIVEQILWLMSQFYTEERKRLITGRDGRPREVNFGSKYLFGKRDVTEPPPYSVQVQVQRRNPLRIQAQNELFLQAYSMSAQAQQYFPLPALFELLNVDGKEKVMPILQQGDMVMQQMQQLQAQNQQLLAQNEQLKMDIGAMQKLNQQYANAQRQGMYPKPGVSGTPLPTQESMQEAAV